MPESINTLKIYGIKQLDVTKYEVPNKNYVLTDNQDYEVDDEIDKNEENTKFIINYY